MSTPSPEEQRAAHRARYEALRAAAQGVTARALPPPSPRDLPLPAPALHTEHIPGGWYWTVRMSRGQALRIATPGGDAAVAMLAWSVADPSERLNTADTIKLQWSAALRKGRLLLTDMGRVAFSITEDSSGAHDSVLGPTTAAERAAKLGAGGAWRNSRDNFLAAAAKLGLTRRDIPLCVSFFAPLGVDDAGRFVWHAGRRQPGDFVDLRAEMDLWVVLSNAGHPADPAPVAEPGAVTATVYQAPPPAADDPCRGAGEEAARAFLFTERHARA